MYKKFYGKGLYLLTLHSGTQAWRYKYRYDGKEKLISLGIYPTISLEEALQRLARCRDFLANGFDPSKTRKYICLNFWEINQNVTNLTKGI